MPAATTTTSEDFFASAVVCVQTELVSVKQVKHGVSHKAVISKTAVSKLASQDTVIKSSMGILTTLAKKPCKASTHYRRPIHCLALLHMMNKAEGTPG